MNDIAFPVAELPNSIKNIESTFLISICIPTYNRVGNLKKSLDSLLVKYGNSPEVEILVIDNGSSDETYDYLVNNSNRHNNTSFYIRKFNAGFDINVLDSYYKAKGEYVHFLGDDDILVFEAFNALIETIKKEAPDLIISDYTVETRKKTFNVVNKPGNSFESIDELFSYVGHYLTFMSSITLKKQAVTVQSMCQYINFKFMHISLMLEILSGKKSKLLFMNKPVAIATDNNPATYDVSYLFLNDLIRSFQLNSKKLDLRKLEHFFISVMCHCLGSNIRISRFLLNNSIIGLIGFKPLLNLKILKSLLRRVAVGLK